LHATRAPPARSGLTSPAPRRTSPASLQRQYGYQGVSDGEPSPRSGTALPPPLPAARVSSPARAMTCGRAAREALPQDYCAGPVPLHLGADSDMEMDDCAGAPALYGARYGQGAGLAGAFLRSAFSGSGRQPLEDPGCYNAYGRLAYPDPNAPRV